MSKIMRLIVGIAMFAGVSASASAQWMVFDPTNWVQNYATAIQTLEQYKQMVQQVMNSTTELQSLADPQTLVNQTIGQLQSGVQATNNLIATLGSGQTAAQNLVSAYGAGGSGNFSNWIASLNQQGQMQSQGVSALAQSVTASNQAVQDAQTQWAKSNSEIGAAPGLHDQLQIVNQNLMTLIQQNQAVNQTLAALAASEAQKNAQTNAATMSGAQQAADQNLQNMITQGSNWMVQNASSPAPSN